MTPYTTSSFANATRASSVPSALFSSKSFSGARAYAARDTPAAPAGQTAPGGAATAANALRLVNTSAGDAACETSGRDVDVPQRRVRKRQRRAFRSRMFVVAVPVEAWVEERGRNEPPRVGDHRPARARTARRPAPAGRRVRVRFAGYARDRAVDHARRRTLTSSRRPRRLRGGPRATSPPAERTRSCPSRWRLWGRRRAAPPFARQQTARQVRGEPVEPVGVRGDPFAYSGQALAFLRSKAPRQSPRRVGAYAAESIRYGAWMFHRHVSRMTIDRPSRRPSPNAARRSQPWRRRASRSWVGSTRATARPRSGTRSRTIGPSSRRSKAFAPKPTAGTREDALPTPPTR